MAPTLTFVSRSNAQIRENFAGACDTSLPTTSAITVEASHPSGLSAVQFRSRIGSGSWTGWQTMSSDGTANRFRRSVGPYAPGENGIAPFQTGAISWEARATSNDGTTRTLTSTANTQITLHWCSLG